MINERGWKRMDEQEERYEARSNKKIREKQINEIKEKKKKKREGKGRKNNKR